MIVAAYPMSKIRIQKVDVISNIPSKTLNRVRILLVNFKFEKLNKGLSRKRHTKLHWKIKLRTRELWFPEYPVLPEADREWASCISDSRISEPLTSIKRKRVIRHDLPRKVYAIEQNGLASQSTQNPTSI